MDFRANYSDIIVITDIPEKTGPIFMQNILFDKMEKGLVGKEIMVSTNVNVDVSHKWVFEKIFTKILKIVSL